MKSNPALYRDIRVAAQDVVSMPQPHALSRHPCRGAGWEIARRRLHIIFTKSRENLHKTDLLFLIRVL